MDKFNRELFEMIGRCKNREASGRAAALPEPRAWYMENGVLVSKPIESKAASGVITSPNINKAKVIADFIFSNH